MFDLFWTARENYSLQPRTKHARPSELLLLDAPKRQVIGKAWEIILENKFPPTLPKSAFASSLDTPTYSDTSTGLD
jgi:hypothetical protein